MVQPVIQPIIQQKEKIADMVLGISAVITLLGDVLTVIGIAAGTALTLLRLWQAIKEERKKRNDT